MSRRGFMAAAPISALFGSGAGGLPAAEPVDFKAVVLPSSPNACLAAPPGGNLQAQITIPTFRADPATAWAALRSLGERFPRTTKLGEWPEQRQAQWVQRSAIMNFPDIIAGGIVPQGEGSGLYLFSRSLFGYSDLGVNRKRVEAWIAAFKASLGEG